MRFKAKVTRGDFFIRPIWPRTAPIPRRKGSFPFSEGRHLRFIDHPIEEIIRAGPCVDFDTANLAIKTAGMLVRMRLPGCRVRHPAFGAVEIFGRPCASGHGANMRRETSLFQRVRLPELTDPYQGRIVTSLETGPIGSCARDFGFGRHQQKTPANRPGFSRIGRISSVTRDQRSAELVVHTRGEEIDVLLDSVGDEAVVDVFRA